VVDDHDVIMSSANFTDAAHHRNIKIGLVFKSESTASAIIGFFDGMLRGGLLTRLKREEVDE
jgi:hypothetical protein